MSGCKAIQNGGSESLFCEIRFGAFFFKGLTFIGQGWRENNE